MKTYNLEEASTYSNLTEYKESVLKRGLLAFEINGKKKETDPNELLAEGYDLFKKGQYDKAIVCYNKAIEINAMFAEAYNYRGDAYYYKGYYDKALWEYNKAIEINPNYFFAYNNRGLVYCQKGRYDKAISEYSKAIEMAPLYAEAYSNRGYAYCLKGQYEKSWDDVSVAQHYGYKVPPEFLKILREVSENLNYP